MSDPRMIPTDEAQRLREELRAIRETPFLRGRDDGRPQEIWIGSLYSHLAREHAEDLAYTVERQAAQIERVREALADLEAEIGRRAAAPHVNPTETTLGMSRAARLIREALGGTDEDH